MTGDFNFRQLAGNGVLLAATSIESSAVYS